mmetsp:Transcript_37906/g.55874  ORF Transcript_37906/g.55874 Transcript_37906/m.55874 type:complete len:232 (-) Transcript_37906:350-1045(-)
MSFTVDCSHFHAPSSVRAVGSSTRQHRKLSPRSKCFCALEPTISSITTLLTAESPLETTVWLVQTESTFAAASFAAFSRCCSVSRRFMRGFIVVNSTPSLSAPSEARRETDVVFLLPSQDAHMRAFKRSSCRRTMLFGAVVKVEKLLTLAIMNGRKYFTGNRITFANKAPMNTVNTWPQNPSLSASRLVPLVPSASGAAVDSNKNACTKNVLNTPAYNMMALSACVNTRCS